ncbi:MAG: RDD family protein [Acidobacteria bacterium]|nr:RDD family protein [Acidobacteriota bacterium]MCK6681793.1 RDD family protein [Thermoanaerobaculia bacterium]
MLKPDGRQPLAEAVRRVETPEGVELTLRTAGVVPRFFAALMDFGIRFFIYLFGAVLFSGLHTAGPGLFLLLLFTGEWFYPVLFELFRRGQTPGKAALGLRVLHDDGTPVTLPSSILRNLLTFADFLPLAFLAGIVSILVTRDFKRLGDLAAGTVVVHDPRARFRRPVPPAAPEAPPVPLSSPEQQAIVEFAERLASWPPERARELASLARPLTGATGTASVDRLSRFASWLVGRRAA